MNSQMKGRKDAFQIGSLKTKVDFATITSNWRLFIAARKRLLSVFLIPFECVSCKMSQKENDSLIISTLDVIIMTMCKKERKISLTNSNSGSKIMLGFFIWGGKINKLEVLKWGRERKIVKMV